VRQNPMPGALQRADQDRASEPDPRTGADDDLADPVVVHEGPVGGPEVLHQQTIGAQRDLGVVAGHRRVFQMKGALGSRSHADRMVQDLVRAPALRSFLDPPQDRAEFELHGTARSPHQLGRKRSILVLGSHRRLPGRAPGIRSKSIRYRGVSASGHPRATGAPIEENFRRRFPFAKAVANGKKTLSIGFRGIRGLTGREGRSPRLLPAFAAGSRGRDLVLAALLR
jgi:hypothetical protein